MSEEPHDEAPEDAVQRRIRAAAERARTEAEARRKSAAAKSEAALPAERNGRDGPEPTRYGDWEVKGVASDF
jgi:hypothetical protein